MSRESPRQRADGRAAARARRIRRSCATRLHARADIADAFLARGAAAAARAGASAAAGDGSTRRLRRQRHGLALAVALGDLAGELPLEEVTRLLSDFADRAIDEAVSAAIAERVPDAEPQGFAVIAMGKLGSHELNYSSDVDLLLLFDPETLPQRERATMPAKRRCGSAGG